MIISQKVLLIFTYVVIRFRDLNYDKRENLRFSRPRFDYKLSENKKELSRIWKSLQKYGLEYQLPLQYIINRYIKTMCSMNQLIQLFSTKHAYNSNLLLKFMEFDHFKS